jgi:two-component system KDP operon response regulator KdpE
MSAHKPRILVIDDEPQIHRFLGPALDAAGYEPVRADTGGAGLSAIANRPTSACPTSTASRSCCGRGPSMRGRS